MSKLRIIAAVIFLVALAVFLYALGAFVAWNVNPGKWEGFGRYMVCMFYFALAFAGCLAILGNSR